MLPSRGVRTGQGEEPGGQPAKRGDNNVMSGCHDIVMLSSSCAAAVVVIGVMNVVVQSISEIILL